MPWDWNWKQKEWVNESAMKIFSLLFCRRCVAQDCVSLEWGGLTSASVHRTHTSPDLLQTKGCGFPWFNTTASSSLCSHILIHWDLQYWILHGSPISVSAENAQTTSPCMSLWTADSSMRLPGLWPLPPSLHLIKRDKKSRQNWPMQISLHLDLAWESSSQAHKCWKQNTRQNVNLSIRSCGVRDEIRFHPPGSSIKERLRLPNSFWPQSWKTHHGDRHHPGVPELFCPRVEWRGACHHLHSPGKAADKSSHLIFQNDYWDIYHAPPFPNIMWQKWALYCRLSSDNNAISSTFWNTLCFSRFSPLYQGRFLNHPLARTSCIREKLSLKCFNCVRKKMIKMLDISLMSPQRTYSLSCSFKLE